MVTADDLATRRALIAGPSDLSRLLARLSERARPVLARGLVVPPWKALLSTDGGVCPRDGHTLIFDPWANGEHRCPHCGQCYRGERHDRWWARFQHLWLGERMAHLAALAVFADDEAADDRARQLLAAYGGRYFQYPNRDNVLGPSRLFFSTYLESIWITHYLAAATFLREGERLDRGTAELVSQVADEAANLIGEFDEGFSNRQTWHNAALAAIAVWFEDEALLTRAVESPTGLLAHLLQGFGPDGLWYEGENYHLFALRGLLTGFQWLRAAGVDPLAEPSVAERLTAALIGPALTALPDATFPARKDSRFGVSLAQPMYLELWEAGLGGHEAVGHDAGGIADWLARLYAVPAPVAETLDSYLHEAGEPVPAHRSRADLSWWMLVAMGPTLAGSADRWQPASALLESQGLAVLRSGGRYASLECGIYGGGHGHPDRLHLTLHQGGVHWLPDFGAGSYVARDLFWYRSTLAHNAPRLDGVSQPMADAACDYFEAVGDWSWVRGRFGELSRTLVSGPAYLLDVVELAGEEERMLELPYHLTGAVEVGTPGRWEPAELTDPFTSDAMRFVPDAEGPIALSVRHADATLELVVSGPGELLRATAPGAPGTGSAAFYLVRARGQRVRIVAVFASGGTAPALAVADDAIEVGTEWHRAVADGWQIDGPSGSVRLRGRRPVVRSFSPLSPQTEPPVQTGAALHTDVPPALDGTLGDFDVSAPLVLDHEDQYRRSEEPYPGPEEFSAAVYAAWDADALYLAVEVTKPEPVFRAADAPPLRLDNEPDDIHSDGLQVYVQPDPEGPAYGWLIAPSEGEPRLRVRPAAGAAGDAAMVEGDWSMTESGYVVTLGIRMPGWEQRQYQDEIGFDILVNEMLPGRERRAGQLVWSGGGGWVYLRGDRQDPAAFGTLQLV
ncbi:MAG TPA: heparinase II/III family protein [Gemmatimonadales bacterium]|nr:heparinase II/III family protein [Gemmatimonadales bacterium]